jgi:pyridoxamine 5'-phosphate oxidase
VIDPAGLRRDYESGGLDAPDLQADPVSQFRLWLDDAVGGGIVDPNAMVLATCDATATPSARTVLLKGVDQRGFSFYTNRRSRKGADLAATGKAALVFPWLVLHRQVTVTGGVEVVSDDESDAYFATRPRGAQVGAWASRQSEVIENRAILESWDAEAGARFDGIAVPRPPWWGGYRVVPVTVEFWQGRADRLHDRLRYTRADPDDRWRIERLSP